MTKPYAASSWFNRTENGITVTSRIAKPVWQQTVTTEVNQYGKTVQVIVTKRIN
jgi:hypothetical protein